MFGNSNVYFMYMYTYDKRVLYKALSNQISCEIQMINQISLDSSNNKRCYGVAHKEPAAQRHFITAADLIAVQLSTVCGAKTKNTSMPPAENVFSNCFGPAPRRSTRFIELVVNTTDGVESAEIIKSKKM